MDDLKFFTKSENTDSDDIEMKFAMEKCEIVQEKIS